MGKRALFCLLLLGLISVSYTQITQNDLDYIIEECFFPPEKPDWDINYDVYDEYDDNWDDWEWAGDEDDYYDEEFWEDEEDWFDDDYYDDDYWYDGEDWWIDGEWFDGEWFDGEWWKGEDYWFDDEYDMYWDLLDGEWFVDEDGEFYFWDDGEWKNVYDYDDGEWADFFYDGMYDEFAEWEDEQYDEYFDDYYEDDYFDYDCDAQCISRISSLDWEALTPCDTWTEYQNSNDYDQNDIDEDMAILYRDCLQEFYYFIFDWPDYLVFQCAYDETRKYLEQMGVSEFDQQEIEDCITECYTDCPDNSACMTYISNNWDDEFCWYEEVQQYEIDEGIIADDTEYGPDSAHAYQMCIEDNLYYIYDPLEVDWDGFYASYDYDTDTFDTSDLDTYSKAYIALECEIMCFYPTENYYDNEQAYIDEYGEDYYEDEEYEDGDFFFEDGWFEGCDGADCFDEDGDLIGDLADQYLGSGAGGDESDDPCDNGLCFYEWLGCIEVCESSYCPASTCYTGAQDTLDSEINQNCQGFVQTKQRLEDANVIQPQNIVPLNYSDQYLQCMEHLSNMADAAGETYVKSFYDCLAGCATEAAVQNDPVNRSSSERLIYMFGMLAIVLLAF